MTYDKIVQEILDSYLNYVSDKYYSVKDNQLKTGLNKYNEIVKDKDFLIINDFTAGRFTNILSSFLFLRRMDGASMGLISGHSKMFKLADGKVYSLISK